MSPPRGDHGGLRVLLAHNRYRSDVPSGENRVVEAQARGLASRGVHVERLVVDSDDIDRLGPVGRLALPLSPTWSASARRRFRSVTTASHPDVLHLHNPYPLLSPSIVRWARTEGIAVVQTVHNHRHVCLAGTFLRDGIECRSCEARRLPWPGVRHGCYRGSRAQSLAQGTSLVVHRGTWRLVDRFLAVSASTAATVRAAGVPADRVEVLANGVPDPGAPRPLPADGAVLFAGRLTLEKGVDVLLDLWSGRAGVTPPPVPLRLAGSGVLDAAAGAVAAEQPAIQVLGPLSPAEVGAEIERAAVVVVPSRWPDPLPTIALEALARGRPVVATAVGGLPEIVDAEVGALVEPTPAGIARGVTEALEDGAARAVAARRRYEARFTEVRALDRLLEVYEQVRAAVTGRGGGVVPPPTP